MAINVCPAHRMEQAAVILGETDNLLKVFRAKYENCSYK